MPDPDNVQDMNSGRPYRRAARAYLRKHWIGPLWLPPRAKEKPPEAYTGRGKPYPDEETIDEWITEHGNGNICMRMGHVDIEGDDPTENVRYDVIGIDVDDYKSGGKQKHGGTQLAELEQQYGPLPATWRSTSRGIDNISGIRYFLAPAGLHFRGKAHKDIDIISPGYRYAIVYPSWHPEDRQYKWYAPDLTEATGLKDIPDAHDFPHLPDEWLEFLTNGRMADEGVDIDMSTSNKRMEAWANRKLPKANPDKFGDDGLCRYMRNAIDSAIAKVEEDPSSHSTLTEAHWNIIRAASEGHAGWKIAIDAVEKHWKEDVLARGKRTLGEVRLEVWRSKINAMRKLKADIDKARGDGIDLLGTECGCYSEGAAGAQAIGVDGVIFQKPKKDPEEYAQSDDGNAQHLLDIIGDDNIRYVPELLQWIVWSEEESRWVTDDNGLLRRIFRRVRDRQYRHAENLFNTAITQRNNGDEDGAKSTLATAREWRKWANRSGSVNGARDAIEAAKSFASITIRADALDDNPFLLGIEGGVLELRSDPEDPWSLRKPLREDMITHNTRTPFFRLSEQYDGETTLADANEAWNKYLDYFMPDIEVRQFLQKVLGYGLLGDNRDRLFVFFAGPTTTGKGTMLSGLAAALGDYIGPAGMSVFQDHKLNPALAEALPRRVITMSELSASTTMHADAIKRVTGGFERMTAELKGANRAVSRIPAFLPIVATNSAPRVPEADDALRRRLVVIPFDRTMPEDKEDTSIGATLARSGGPVVLRWLVGGWEMYAREGLSKEQFPARVRYTTEKFAASMSDIGTYLAERLKPSADRHDNVPTSLVYDDYRSWCMANYMPERDILTPYKFASALQSQGYKIAVRKIGGNSVRCVLRVNLRAEARILRIKKNKV